MQQLTLAQLVELNRRLLETPRLDDALQLLARSALAMFPADHVSLRLCDGQGQLRSAARAGVGAALPAPRFRSDEGVMGWVAQTGGVARLDDAAADRRFAARRERRFPITSLLSVPVARTGSVQGVLSVSSAHRAAFTADHEALAQLLASTVAHSLHHAELTQLAMTDPQTLAYNHRCLIPRLREEMERALRQTQPLSVLLLDLDHFKRVNDRHGHASGDAVLRGCADRVRQCVRAADVLVRRGGEEFVLIMPATDNGQALQVAERVRRRLAAVPFRLASGRKLMQTASIGVATWDGLETAELLEERADRAMYAAKRDGRNRVQPSGCAPASHELGSRVPLDAVRVPLPNTSRANDRGAQLP